MNELHVVSTLPAALVRELATAALRLAESRTPRRGLFVVEGTRVRGCEVCSSAWDEGATPRHEEGCLVGWVTGLALRAGGAPGIVADQSLRDRAERTVVSGALDRLRARASQASSVCSISAQAPVADGGRTAGELCGASEGYGEPWMAAGGEIEDRDGRTVVHPENSDLILDDEQTFAERIALCVNFCAPMSDEWLRDALAQAAGLAALPADEAMGGVLAGDDPRIQSGPTGWFVQVDAANQLHFPDYGGAQAYLRGVDAAVQA